MATRIGLVIGSSLGPDQLASAAQQAEGAGFADLWLAEDFFFTGGISGAAIALGATSRIRVGLGVVSALVRHPALLAMEISTLARSFPGRFLPGIGLGVPAWMRQMGLLPDSPLAAVRDCVTAVRRLLEGDELTAAGQIFEFNRVRLEYPQSESIPLYLGVIGPKMLELSGEIADGSVLSVLSGPKYVRWARERIATGRQRGGRTGDHQVTAFAIYSVDHSAARAKEAARAMLAFHLGAGGRNALTDLAEISDRLPSPPFEPAAILDEWVDDLAIAGSPTEVLAKIQNLIDAGADSVALFPTPAERAAEIIELTAGEVLSRM
ncbi:MAG TPA: LLM class flavin-dependent oxidoreductase [Acidimicrobiia bacterium]|nr:LLM class flavin-dependent oxidoreductase [Acidimicrobiia bacterium]